MLYPESLKSRHIRRKQSFKSVIKLVKHQFFLRSSVWWDCHLFKDSYMEWLWRPSDSFAIGFCGLDKAQRSIAFLAFWCSICCGYRPLNQQIDNIHSFIFCKDFAPSMKLPLVNKLQDNFKSRLECFVFVFRFLYYYYFFFIIFFHTETSPLLQWPPHVCRHEPLTDQQKRKGSQSMRFHGLRWHQSFG